MSFVYFYETCLYLIIVFYLTPDSIGIFGAVDMPVRIYVHGVCYSVMAMKIGCIPLYYFHRPLILLEFVLWQIAAKNLCSRSPSFGYFL